MTSLRSPGGGRGAGGVARAAVSAGPVRQGCIRGRRSGSLGARRWLTRKASGSSPPRRRTAPPPPLEPAIGLDGELALLEARVAEAAELVVRLREERTALAGESETLRRECGELRRECESLRRDHDALRREREEAAARLTQIIAKVDALRGEP